MLYLIATPIGNLADISLRAIDTLKSVDYILCEDTRHSKRLLTHHSIDRPLRSYHKFNESKQEEQILHDLSQHTNIALISDAGTPGISDPGTQLVKRCHEKNIAVTPIPGPCAAISALSSSGMPTNQFQFIGFLPKKKTALKKILPEIVDYRGTTICYESPTRLLSTLELLHALLPTRHLCIARELTKKHEEILHGTPETLLNHWKERPVKGEIVLLIAPNDDTHQNQWWKDLTPAEHIQALQGEYELTQKEALKIAAEQRGTTKSTLYRHIHHKD